MNPYIIITAIIILIGSWNLMIAILGDELDEQWEVIAETFIVSFAYQSTLIFFYLRWMPDFSFPPGGDHTLRLSGSL